MGNWKLGDLTMGDDKAIIPLQNQVRERLFGEWVVLLNDFRDYRIAIQVYSGTNDPELLSKVVKRIETLRLDLLNYEDLEITINNGLQDEIEAIGRILFRLGIIDATVEKKVRVVVSDW